MDAHGQSTQALLELAGQGADYAARHAKASVRCRAGPFSFTVVSNSSGLSEKLTRCLLQGGDGADLTIALLVGRSRLLRRHLPWNLPHTDSRHVERLHVSTDGALTALLQS